ncbi:MAG: CPBP family glutamic-type intramembrane protease [Pedobacter sp.]
MYQSLSNYWQFLKRPRLLRFSKNKLELRKDFITLLILDFVIAFAVMGTISTLLHYKLIKEYPIIDLTKQYGLLVTGILLCVVAPLLEESVFRYQLRKRRLSIYFIAISLAWIVISNVNNSYLQLSFLIAFIILAILCDMRFKSMSMTRSYLLWQRWYGWLFYLTAFIFAYAHLSNIKGLTVADPSFILYILAQLVVGMSLGYLRIKYGLIYAMLGHASYNGLIFIAMAFSGS